MAQVILAAFNNPTDANDALVDLRDAGFNSQEVSVIAKQGVIDREDIDKDTTVAEGTLAGATTGTLVGALAGLLTGLGAIDIPGLGGILIGGPIAAALGLTGAAATTVSGAVTGALAGGLIGALTGWGVPEDRARVYEEKIKQGGVLLAVPITGDNQDEAHRILDNNNVAQIDTVDMDTNKIP